MAQDNRKVVLKSGFEGAPRADHFKIVKTTCPVPGEREFLVRHIYLSLDPYQRIAMGGRYVTGDGPANSEDMPSADTIGQVIASRHEGFAEGDYVLHQGGWQEYSLSDGAGVQKLTANQAPLSTYLSVLGMPGLTAYASMIELADVKAGQTVLVSAASGPVGSMVGQIAMKKGAQAIGIAGSSEKCAFVKEQLGFTDCVDYKAPEFLNRLEAVLPKGVDIYHDNVGGQMLLDAMNELNNYGTVILCGLISQYNDPSKAIGLPLNLPILKRAVIKGLVVYDFAHKQKEFLNLVAPWVADGSIKFKEDRAQSISATPEHFVKLMSGKNFGKSLVVLGEE